MSDSPSGNLDEGAPAEDSPGILAGLPRTRPQRASARRTAARAQQTVARTTKPSGSSVGQSGTITARVAKSSKSGVRISARSAGRDDKRTNGPSTPSAASPSQATKRARAKTHTDAERRAGGRHGDATAKVPRQGYEAETEPLGPVQPPGSTELLSSAAELAGELAKAGVTTSARVLKDFLSRLQG